MSRSTAETLKQIQKQGLSISIVTGDNSIPFPLEAASKETKDKQNTVASENITTSQTAVSSSSESKPTVTQPRHAVNIGVETRASSIHPPNQTVSAISEGKAQNLQMTNNLNFVETKSQLPLSNRLTPNNKNQPNLARLSQNSSITEKRTAARTVQNNSNLLEVKTPNRNIQTELKNPVAHPHGQNANLLTDKLNTSQNRVPVSSPSLETKPINTPGRISQNCATPVHTGGPRNQVKITELKTNSVAKIIPVKQCDTRILSTPKGYQNIKLIAPPRSISQFQPTTNNKQTEKVATEKSLNNPFRVASTLTKNIPEEKTVKVTKISHNISTLENQPIQSRTTTQQASLKIENKGVSQGIKISELSSELHQRPVSSGNSSEVLSPRVNTMPIPKAGVKRVGLITSTPVSKRKCVKLISPLSDHSSSQSDVNPLSSDESPVKDKKVYHLKNLTPGLTITPVSATPSTSGNDKKAADSQSLLGIVCASCNQVTINSNTCENCHQKFTPSSIRCHIPNSQTDSPAASIVVTQNVTTCVVQRFKYEQSQQIIKVAPRRGRPKRRFVEPVCYTLSSDDEEAPFESLNEDGSNSQIMYPPGTMESEGSKSEHSSTSDMMQDESYEYEYPGVSSINCRQQMNNNNDEEDEEEEELEHDMESEEELGDEELPEFEDEEIEEELEDEEVPPDEDERPIIYNKMFSTNVVVKCRSIRIGSYKIHPEKHESFIDVTFSCKSVHFLAPVIVGPKKCSTIVLKAPEIAQMWIHFGKCLPIIFAYTSKAFGEAVRKLLNMTKEHFDLFDPSCKDLKRNKLTFLIDTLNEEQKTFMRQIFPGPDKLKEIDQKEANEILVKSTPQQNLIKIESADGSSPLPKVVTVSGIIPANLTSTNLLKIDSMDSLANSPISSPVITTTGVIPASISITKVPAKPVPVIKMLTYPPPPLTGGVAINSADFATLEEGEFLNDAILDFYLKYVFYEKLSKEDREKTHIFSSFFYPRLTQKPDRLRPGDDVAKTMQVRRHNQVKTWTKHVDIFSKDYIVIPVNQHNHWFLAFVCYPGHVPEAPIAKVEQNADGVSSTEEAEVNKIIIKEELNNSEDLQNQDDNSINSNSMYEVEEPDSDEDISTEMAENSMRSVANVIIHESNHPRKEIPCILIFDSLSGPNRWRIASTLREYLEMEWKMRKGTRKIFDRNTMQGFIVKCPQQTNFSDCGLYVLQYVESFFDNPIPYFGNPMPDLTNWFSDTKISRKRQEIKDLILSLQKQYRSKQNDGKKLNQSPLASPTITTLQSDKR